jgi:hypothetical protein
MNAEYLWWFVILLLVGGGAVAFLALGSVPEIEPETDDDNIAPEIEPGSDDDDAWDQSEPVSTVVPGPAAPPSTSDTP